MNKRIVLCTDGTWDNTANNTNVYKVAKAVTTNATQVSFYDDGVGANGTPIEKLVGGAFGTGLFQKVKDGYTQVAHLYQQNDPIFLFGFSRGAYTARSIAGMIAICGLPTKDFDSQMVDAAFQAYRNPSQRETLLAQLNQNYDMYNARITMLGVWDTVGSLGIPAIFGGVDNLLYGFLDTSLHPDVLHAYQAIAIDERRIEFPPTRLTIVGIPAAMYSSTALGRPSAREGRTAMSQLPRISGISARRPRNRNSRFSPNASACRSKAPRCSPSPTRTNLEEGNSRITAGAHAINHGCPFTSLCMFPTRTTHFSCSAFGASHERSRVFPPNSSTSTPL